MHWDPCPTTIPCAPHPRCQNPAQAQAQAPGPRLRPRPRLRLRLRPKPKSRLSPRPQIQAQAQASGLRPQAPGPRPQALGPRSQVPGPRPWVPGPGSRVPGPGPRPQAPGPWPRPHAHLRLVHVACGKVEIGENRLRGGTRMTRMDASSMQTAESMFPRMVPCPTPERTNMSPQHNITPEKESC